MSCLSSPIRHSSRGITRTLTPITRPGIQFPFGLGLKTKLARGISSTPLRGEDAFGGFYNMPVAGLTDEQQEVSILLISLTYQLIPFLCFMLDINGNL